jgi:hypothetical protein
MKLVQALVNANKDFDLRVFPEQPHSPFQHRRMHWPKFRFDNVWCFRYRNPVINLVHRHHHHHHAHSASAEVFG